MTRKYALTFIAVFLGSVFVVGAQEGAPAMTPEQQAEMELYLKAGTPGEPHEMMAATAGSYSLTLRSWGEPGAEPMESTGTATRSMTLDGRVRVEEVAASSMGMPFTGFGMMGFDNVTEKYWSTWNDSMSTGIMISEGTCDDDGSCTFSGSWNDPILEGPMTVRMVSWWKDSTTEIFEMFGAGRDGAEMKMMSIEYLKQ